jgi:hypothetical protein
MTLAFIDER